MFHLFSRSVYRAIGGVNNRNRCGGPHFSVKAKLIALDFVFGYPECRLLATEQETLGYFVGDRGIDRHRPPGKTYTARSSGAKNRRYFIEKYSIYFEPDKGSPVPSVCHVDEGSPSTSGFTSSLAQHRQIFASLRTSRLAYAAAEHRPLRRAIGVFERFETSLNHTEDLLPSGPLEEYFRLRFDLELHQYHLLDKGRLDRLRTLAKSFQHACLRRRRPVRLHAGGS